MPTDLLPLELTCVWSQIRSSGQG